MKKNNDLRQNLVLLLQDPKLIAGVLLELSGGCGKTALQGMDDTLHSTVE